MTLKEQQAADVAVLLNTDDFAESCTYYPKGGDARTVSANVDEDVIEVEERTGLTNVRRLEVLVSTDPTTGIDSPKHGDGLKRENGEDIFSFEGEPKEVSANTHLLTFLLKGWVNRGGSRMQK